MNRAVFFLSLFLVVFAPVGQAQEAEAPAEGSAVEGVTDYVIGPGDLLSVMVYDAPDLSRDVRVSARGYVLMPLLSEPVRADGLTVEELAGELGRHYQDRQILRNPQITVLVKEYKSRPVAVVGAVRHPQRVPILGPTTLLQVLSAVGGLAENAGNRIYVTRGAARRQLPSNLGEAEEPAEPGVRTIVVGVDELMEMRNPAANVLIFAGDLITVPRAGIIYVVGAVNKPGGYLLQSRREHLTVLQAVALAENMTGTARPRDSLIIRRPPGTDEETAIEVDVAKIMARQAPDPALQENDILFIPDSP
ncbi:MAG: polysaccharide biosynthesis/export family protein, partial [Terriglobia bacterium]